MNKNIPFWQVGGFLFASILGTFLHFLFDLTGGSAVAAVFSAAALPQGVHCTVLLLGAGELPAVAAEQVIGCGFSPRSTLTLSSLGPPRAVLSVQRVLRCPDGRCVLPQDIPLPRQWCALPPETQLLLAGMELLLGTMEG